MARRLSLVALLLVAALAGAATVSAQDVEVRKGDIPGGLGADVVGEFTPSGTPKPSTPGPDTVLPTTDVVPIAAPAPAYGAYGGAATPSAKPSPRPGAQGGARAPSPAPGTKGKSPKNKSPKNKPTPAPAPTPTPAGPAPKHTSVCKGPGYSIKAPYLAKVHMMVSSAAPHEAQVAKCEELCIARGPACKGWYYKKDGYCYMTKAAGSFRDGFDALKACKIHWA
ncbi:hypothetical protein HYH02_012293 [Chlamydomonas schloesseri]|uniref:Apple domain-containing protein n=1 Tax=Chlamydomonas schloesseri TaxID=2026947 RepID=A0A835T227_9CHLO|nr:hypothetical protein HYH02_012293 [Chlamydomonas schloesseri]|eukprot:KAG2434463.1 hypothetical protein HYH02_012293 [Chlamydomonas schloesseri]